MLREGEQEPETSVRAFLNLFIHTDRGFQASLPFVFRIHTRAHALVQTNNHTWVGNKLTGHGWFSGRVAKAALVLS